MCHDCEILDYDVTCEKLKSLCEFEIVCTNPGPDLLWSVSQRKVYQIWQQTEER